MEFLTTLICVAIMLAYAIPGFLLVKGKLIKESSIPAFANVLLYVCQPFMTLYAFQKITFSVESLKNIGLAFALSVAINFILLGIFYLVFRKKSEEIKYRIYTLACFFGNCLFMGLPLIEALLPECPEAVIYANMYFLTMSLIGWTAGSAIICRDKRYISAKKIFLNPGLISLVVAFIFYFAKVTFPAQIADMVTILGKMSTPLCMLIMGMRLATMPVKEIFKDWGQYIVIAVKQLLMPLFVFGLLYFLPIDINLKKTLFIVSATPIASVVLNFAEMLNSGQREAASLVLLGTFFSIGTIPLVTLMLPLFS